MRAFLVDAMTKVSDGTLPSDEARNIAKLAAQINENAYAEIKAAKLQIELGREVSKWGDLPVSSEI